MNIVDIRKAIISAKDECTHYLHKKFGNEVCVFISIYDLQTLSNDPMSSQYMDIKRGPNGLPTGIIEIDGAKIFGIYINDREFIEVLVK